jgi:hypothetical protein
LRNTVIKWAEAEVIDIYVIYGSVDNESSSRDEVAKLAEYYFQRLERNGGPVGRVITKNIAEFDEVISPSIVVMTGENLELILLSKQVELSTEFKLISGTLLDQYKRNSGLCASEILYDDSGEISLGAISAANGAALKICFGEQLTHVMGLTGTLRSTENSILSPMYEGEFLSELDWCLLAALYRDELKAGREIKKISKVECGD